MRWIKWALVVGAWAAYIVLSLLLLERSDFGGGDFHLYYRSVRDYLPALLPYPTVIGALRNSWTYPPLLGQALMPLVNTFDMQSATRLWYLFSLLAMMGLVAALLPYVEAERRPMLWLLPLGFISTFEALRIGQVNVILLALIGFAWVAAKSNRFVLVGGLLAVAAWIKLYPALILIYFLWKRNWRVVIGGVVVGAGLLGVQIAISGVDVMVEFVRSLLMIAGQGDTDLMWKNISIYGVASKLFQPNERVIPLLESPILFLVTRYGLSLLALVTLFGFSAASPPHRGSLRDSHRFDLEFALAVLTMLLLSPWIYTDSVSPAFISLFILWRYRRGLWLALAGVALVANYLLMWYPAATLHALILCAGFYGVALLWGVNLSLLTGSAQRVDFFRSARHTIQ